MYSNGKSGPFRERLTQIENAVTFPANIELTDNSFIAKGQLDITHGELGLSASMAAGGALRVRDLLVLKYEISGTAVAESEQWLP